MLSYIKGLFVFPCIGLFMFCCTSNMTIHQQLTAHENLHLFRNCILHILPYWKIKKIKFLKIDNDLPPRAIHMQILILRITFIRKLNFLYFCRKLPKIKNKIRCASTSHYVLFAHKVRNSGHLRQKWSLSQLAQFKIPEPLHCWGIRNIGSLLKLFTIIIVTVELYWVPVTEAQGVEKFKD